MKRDALPPELQHPLIGCRVVVSGRVSGRVARVVASRYGFLAEIAGPRGRRQRVRVSRCRVLELAR